MHPQAGHSQQTTPYKRLTSLGVALAAVSLPWPAFAQSVTAVARASWVTVTLVSVSTVIVLWIAAALLSGVAKKMHWLTPHRHSRLARGVQVVFGGLLLMALMMPYLTLNHPVVAAGLGGTAVFMLFVVGSRNRRVHQGTN